MNNRKDFLELIKQITDEYPELNNVATDDLENPRFLFIGDVENFEAFSNLMSLVAVAEMTLEEELKGIKTSEELFNEMVNDGEFGKLLEFKPEDDDEDKGPLQ